MMITKSQGQFYNDQDYNFDVRLDEYFFHINSKRLEDMEARPKWIKPFHKEIIALFATVKESDLETIFDSSTVTVFKDKIEMEDFYGD